MLGHPSAVLIAHSARWQAGLQPYAEAVLRLLRGCAAELQVVMRGAYLTLLFAPVGGVEGCRDGCCPMFPLDFVFPSLGGG
jgi:hypothetical protein